MDALVYDCPNCLEHYVLWDSSKPPISAEKHNDLSEVIRKQYDEVGSCKKCVRQDPNIPTTFEMDGLLTPKDIRERNKVYLKCTAEDKWVICDMTENYRDCPDCGKALLSDTIISIRSFSPTWEKKFKKKR